MTDRIQAPPRLVQTQGPAGDCVREALAHEGQRLPSPPRFALLQERRLRAARRQRGLALLAFVGALIGLRTLQHPREPLLDIRAELAANSPAPREPALTAVLSAEAPQTSPPSPLPPPKLEGTTPSPPKPAGPRPGRPLLAREEEPNLSSSDVVAARSSEASAPGGAKACAQLARDGAAEPALACYAQLTRGTGMSAELALFEQARLEGKALRRPDRALATLDEYRRRFPNGSLRGEVMLAQIDWLLASGNSTAAGQIVEEALASGLLSERTVELERLRATLGSTPRE